MKNLFKTFNLCLASMAMLFMYSCQQDDVATVEKNGVEFIFTGDRVGNSNNAGRDNGEYVADCDMSLASYAIITMGGNDYTIDLKAWGDNYKTELVELDPGSYEVTSCMLYDADDNPLYATPMTGSEFGRFVDQSLPFSVEVEEYRKIEYDIDVLCVEDFTPPQFGFVFWNVNMKEVKNLCIFANFCEPEEGHKVATLYAEIYPSELATGPNELIWSGSADGDYESEDEANELLCLKFPYDASIPADEQSFYIKLYINDILFDGTMTLDRVDLINEEEGYLHLNENCKGDFDVFRNSYNIAWEDIVTGPPVNDVDFNDFVVKTTTFTDISTGYLNYKFDPLARGGVYNHAFRFWLPGTGYVISGEFASISEIDGNTAVTVYPNTREAFTTMNKNFVNVKCDGDVGTGISKTITIESAPVEFTFFLLSPFDANLGVSGSGGDYDLTAGNLFPTSTFMKDGQEYPNGFVTDQNWLWGQETVDIRTIYGNNFIINSTPIIAPATYSSFLYTGTGCP